MADNLINLGPYGSYVIFIIVLGSFIDIVQFFWLAKRWFRAVRNRYRNQVKRELLLEQLDLGRKRGASHE